MLLSRGDHDYRGCVAGEVVLEKILMRAKDIFRDLVEFLASLELPIDFFVSLREFYGEVRLEKV